MKNTTFTHKLISRRRGVDVYTIANYEGMTKDEILDACDRNNFGGNIYGDTAEVYTD